MRSELGLVSLTAVVLVAGTALAEERFVGPSETYATIQAALEDAVDGDVVTVRAGTYAESLESRADGVTLRADGAVIVESAGRVLRVRHARFTVEGLVLDGGYGDADAVQIQADDVTLRGVEVRRAGRDCVDIGGAVARIRIESSLVHHCLWSTSVGCADSACREDAHGVVADQVQGLTLVDTEIHTFSGDALQLNGRDQPTLWDDVLLERCRMWSGPLAEAEGGYAAGVNPAENAIDTKTPDDIEGPARMTIVDTDAWGFRGGLISNMAAYNLKENVRVRLDRVSVWDSEIAFRLRGATSSRPRGAQVTVVNAVVWDVDTAVRYEDDIAPVTLWHVTLGGSIGQLFQRASAPDGVVTSTNVLVLGGALPAEATGPGSLAVNASAFVDAAAHDYHLADGSRAVDAATALAEVTLDRDGLARPQGAAADVGAYERCTGDCAPIDAGPAPRDAGSSADASVSTDGGTRTDGGRGRDGGNDETSEGGCGCRVAGDGSRAPALLLALAGAAWFRWRRPRRR